MRLPRFLMSASAFVMALLGLLGTFAPEYLLQGIGAPTSPALLLGAQVLGALYLGFSGLNWMARGNLIGGIYSRPVAIGNLMHFLTAGLAMIKAVAQSPALESLWPLAGLYAAFAAAFAVVLIRHPVRIPSSADSPRPGA